LKYAFEHRTFQAKAEISVHQMKKWLCSLTARRKLTVIAEDISCRWTMSYLLCELWIWMLVLELLPASIIQTVPTFPNRPILIARGVIILLDIQNWQTVFLCHLPLSGENQAPLPGFADTFHQQRVCKGAAKLKSMS